MLLFEEVVGFVAATLTTVSFLPQAYKVYKTQHTADLSLWMFILFSVGIFLWLVYGLLVHSRPVIIANALSLLLSGYILSVKVRNG